MAFLNEFFLKKKDDSHEKFLKSFCIVPLAKSSFRSGSARSFNTQYGHLSPESSADEAGEEQEVEEEARQEKDVLVREQQKEEKVRGRPERRKTQRIDYNQIDEAEEERKRLEKELEELNRQQAEDEIRKDEEEKKKVQDENDRQSVILEMIGGLKPPSGSRARSVPRGRRREKVVAEVSGKRELILGDPLLR